MADDKRQKRQRELTKLVRDLQAVRDEQEKLLERERDRKAMLEQLASSDYLAKPEHWSMIAYRSRQARRWQKKLDSLSSFEGQGAFRRALWPVLLLICFGAFYDPEEARRMLMVSGEMVGQFGNFLIDLYYSLTAA